MSPQSDHPAFIQFSAWLEAFNSLDRDALAALHARLHFPYFSTSNEPGSLEHEYRLAQATGGFDVADIEPSPGPASIRLVLKERRMPGYARASMKVDLFKPTTPVIKFGISPMVTPLKFIHVDDPKRKRYERALQPLTSDLRRAVVSGVIDTLRERYVNPKKGETIAAALEAHLKRGDYKYYVDSGEFANRLVQDMHVAGHDKHMTVGFLEPRYDFDDEDEDGAAEGYDELDEDDVEDFDEEDGDRLVTDFVRQRNFGFGTVALDAQSVADRTIATLPITAFLPLTVETGQLRHEMQAAMADVMSSVADADALIIDVRNSHGGDPHMVAFILSFLLEPGPLHILDFVDRRGKAQESFFTLAPDQLPEGSKPFGPTKPVVVLTSGKTVSGGEDLAYSLQASQRAAAIIGEGVEHTTGSASLVTDPRVICEAEFGRGWWLVAVPDRRLVHKLTGATWERVGVKSDVVAGRGPWATVPSAHEVARRMLVQILNPTAEVQI